MCGKIIFFLSTRVYLWFVIHKLAKFPSNPVKILFMFWYIFLDILGTIRIWEWNIMPKYRTHLYLEYWDNLSSSLRTNLWWYIIKFGRTEKILAEEHVHILFFINVEKLIISHILQVQFPSQVLKVGIMKHVLHEWLLHTS